MPSVRVPGEGLESDRPSGPLTALTHMVHDSSPGGGKPPPPVVTTVRHVHLMGGVERETPRHSGVHQGCREEAQVVGRGRGPRKHGGSLLGLRANVGGVDLP